MEVIMLKDVDKVGDKYQIVTVKNGHGRNLLIPTGAAIVANSTNRRQLAELIRQDDVRESKRLDEYRSLAKAVNAANVTLSVKAGTSGKIFGSISPAMLANALQEQGVTVERKRIILGSEIKELGSYTANVQLHKEVAAELKFEVVAAN